MTAFIPDPAGASEWCRQQRRAGHQIGYVPTMGALHEGHLSLVDRAVAENDVTCASIFVNPLQFNSHADLEHYPRDLQRDVDMMDQAGCDMVYTGSLNTFFPEYHNPEDIPPVEPLPAIAGLEANCRPGHLEGVQAIVERLFATVGECRAYFGEKDFQQTLLVKQIADARGDITVVVCPTVREASGLALSSRNTRLGNDERELALVLVRALRVAERLWNDGKRDPIQLEQAMQDALDVPGFRLEYAAIRDPGHWTEETPGGPLRQARALVAGWVGEVRLIDNIALT